MSRYNHADHLIDQYYPYLDKGFIALKDYIGSDESIEAAARVSYQQGTRQKSDCRNLIRYLVRNKHTSPLEQGSVIFHFKAPLFIIQQILRHRTAKLNQESFRYSEVKEEYYNIDSDEWRTQSATNKQGSEGVVAEWPEGKQEEYAGEYGQFFPTPGDYLDFQQQLLNNKQALVYRERLELGVAKEIARKDIPVSTYSSLYWKMDIHNLFHFLKLRLDPHAQKEVRDLAYLMACIVKEVYPICFEAFEDYAHNAITLTRLDRMLLSYIYDQWGVGGPSIPEQFVGEMRDVVNKNGIELGMGKRELDEFWNKLELPQETSFVLPKPMEIDQEESQSV